MITKKKLLDRIQSLEEYLGIAYTNEQYPEHIQGEYGNIKDFKKGLKRIYKLEEKLKKEEKEDKSK